MPFGKASLTAGSPCREALCAIAPDSALAADCASKQDAIWPGQAPTRWPDSDVSSGRRPGLGAIPSTTTTACRPKAPQTRRAFPFYYPDGSRDCGAAGPQTAWPASAVGCGRARDTSMPHGQRRRPTRPKRNFARSHAGAGQLLTGASCAATMAASWPAAPPEPPLRGASPLRALARGHTTPGAIASSPPLGASARGLDSRRRVRSRLASTWRAPSRPPDGHRLASAAWRTSRRKDRRVATPPANFCA